MSSTALSPISNEHRELGRFLAVAGKRFAAGHGPAEMFSPAVDAAWHRMLGTPEYAAFSAEHAGSVLGHRAVNGFGPIGWVATYEEAYGPLPEIWFTDADGVVDRTAFARYEETGTVVAEWDCGPTTGDRDDAAPSTRRS
ncbi:hypothetical protein MHW47_03720 [Streptomyces sp. OfavH-34-F]|uniref:hypothetical protein n=1 Tax=Streptomyces sp. OfavH-34-F TaxID=2917760 RepID=UPI001EF3225C|nr:hypothetical protein [Streptomyces sp. OfavH-34-F]MCG7523555.1 hypothetical protein [Streptomyces sp. OfavH-34-F]